MALIIDIADAVVSELNDTLPEVFSPPFTAVRRVLPEFELAELTDLKVTVVPKSIEISGATRGAGAFDYEVDIGVQKKLGKNIDAEVTELCGLVETIIAFMRQRPLGRLPYLKWVRTRNDPVYAPEHLAEQRTFTSVITLSYRSIG